MAFDRLLDILKKAGIRYPALQQRIHEADALGRWDSAVGPVIAKHARPLRVQDQTLYVEVDHPIWQSELHHRKQQILTSLNKTQAALPSSQQVIVKDIFFVSLKKSKF